MTKAPGIAPKLLAEQVRSTAGWALDGAHPAAAVILRAERSEISRAPGDTPDLEYLRLLLAAHYLTVATFVPTDVDARIRHHVWQGLSADDLEVAVAVVDEAASWDASRVSERVVEGVSGHDGEWLSVRAGALGVAIAMGAERTAAHLADRIDAELAREAQVFDRLARDPARALDALRAATVLAHNSGDLSRVVDAWPALPALAPLRARYTRLGHADRPGGAAASPWGVAFVRAGVVNKAMMATENHRFLALRKAKALRGARELLLPIGPFFDVWGARVARTFTDDADRASVIDALLETHLRGPDELGCLRALAGMHAALSGGIDRLAPALPARLRKVLASGSVRAALKTTAAQHDARLVHRWQQISRM